MDAAAELGRNPVVSKHQIQPEYEDEQADAGWDCRVRLARPNSQARTNADREIFIFPVQLTTCGTGNLTRLIHTLAAICVIILTYSAGTFNMPTSYQWVWEREAHINWYMVTCQGNTRICARRLLLHPYGTTAVLMFGSYNNQCIRVTAVA